ncbi:MAG: sugar ABC transporter substrate-binding protein [Actinobacteria bacterium]|nr:MAG: sugar ABC transporter substrate-binding protein [Actinomycetota bacterium]
MSKFSRRSTVLVAVAAAVGLTALVATATGGTSKKQASADVCFLLPDTKTSIRWEQFDRPAMAKALKAAGVSNTIVNAQGDPQKQRSQADQCLANGAKVLIIAPIDSGSAAAIEKTAAAKGVKSIDYDRQVEGGVASVYVSFNGHTVGVLQGKGVVNGLKANGKYSQHPVVAQLNGGQEDANSFLFKGGYDSVLDPLFKKGTLKKGPDQFTPGWDNQKAGTIFEQMLVKTGNKIDGVAAANDGLANAVVVALKAHKLKPIPLSGQDATPLGVQNIISGWQSMTVFKDVRKLATVAAKAAVQIVKGQKLTTTGTIKTKGRGPEPTILIAPQSITKANYKLLFTSGFLKKGDVCNGSFSKFCK